MLKTDSSTSIAQCRICGNNSGRVVDTTERMFGFGGDFHYFECGKCGCVQLMNVPADLSFYYPPDKYYSFKPRPECKPELERTGLKRWLYAMRNGYALFHRPFYAALLQYFRPAGPEYKTVAHLFRNAPGLSIRSRILDVGSGQGWLLEDLAKLGFSRLHGVDPFINDTISSKPQITLHKCFVEELQAGKFDLILSQDSLEHVIDPLATLTAMAERLAPGGTCRVELPVAASRVWQEYGGIWVDLDPPRHIFLFTQPSMEIVAAKAGLKVVACDQVGTYFGFMGSEQYKLGRTLFDYSKGRYGYAHEEFTLAEIAAFQALADKANADGVGGRLAFWMRHSDR